MDRPYFHHTYPFVRGFLALILFVVLVGLVTLGVLAVMHYRKISSTTSGGPSAPPAEGPVEVLKMRLAKGEIDEADFRSRMEILSAHT